MEPTRFAPSSACEALRVPARRHGADPPERPPYRAGKPSARSPSQRKSTSHMKRKPSPAHLREGVVPHTIEQMASGFLADALMHHDVISFVETRIAPVAYGSFGHVWDGVTVDEDTGL